jgi:hypothetical protein
VADDVVDDQLACGRPERAGETVDDEQDHGVPRLQRASEEEQRPGQRRRDEGNLRPDDDLAAVITIGKPAEPHAEYQKWCPVTDHGEARQRGGVEHLEDDPVRDDVLDVVGHLRQHSGREVRAERAMTKCREGRAGR